MNINPSYAISAGAIKGNGSKEEQANKTAQGFESIILSILLKEMKESPVASGLFNESPSMYEDIGYSMLAETLSKRGGLGLADKIEKEMMESNMSGINDLNQNEWEA